MVTPRRLLSSLFIIGLLVLAVMFSSMPQAAKAQAPTDGRINILPWGNSWGPVVVYCTNSLHNSVGSFKTGFLEISNGLGVTLLSASESLILEKQAEANSINSRILIISKGNYLLYALPGGRFELDSLPDKEGKELIGRWTGCTPVTPAPEGDAPKRVFVA